MSRVSARPSESFVINHRAKNSTAVAVERLHLSGKKPVVRGLENLLALEQPAILALTHRRMTEPLKDMAFFHRELHTNHPDLPANREVYSATMDAMWRWRWLYLGRLIERYGAFPVDRKGGLTSIKELLGHGAHILTQKEAHLMIYPEGRVGKNDTVKAKVGTAQVALATGAPILPIGQWLHERGTQKSVVIHPPIHTETNPELLLQPDQDLNDFLRRTARAGRLLTEQIEAELQTSLDEARTMAHGDILPENSSIVA
ncbi:MAG TPA: lysophospholipid acyltransferase family protein [Candidatus Saccharimonadales bacterium]|nr:lysophospholipid acyltransferase family protein [Candidatus Saccharimonadales bacterium]